MAPLIPIAIELASQFAPGIIKAITGSDKAADVAGKVVEVAQAVTGTDNPTAAAEVLKADPAKLLEFQQHMADIELESEKQRYADIANARAMQIAALGQDDTFSKRFVYMFASAWSLFAMVYFAAVTFIPLSAGGQRVADTILGVLITSVIGVMFAYFYGSTKGSAEKTRLLAQSAPAK